MENLNLLFNKMYYCGLGSGDAGKVAKDVAKRIRELHFDPNRDYQACPVSGASVFWMKACYPGLICGVGYGHPKAQQTVEDDEQNEIDNGFCFDFTSGQPFIPGSSVKGMLRSLFRYPEVIWEELGKEGDCDAKWVKSLEASIFEGEDIFLDAVVRKGNQSGLIMDIDFITPHKDVMQSPDIHTVLRIRPNAVLEFRFLLKASGDCDAETKTQLFQKLIEDFGIGAKTNVGYGILKPVTEAELTTGSISQSARPSYPAERFFQEPVQPVPQPSPKKRSVPMKGETLTIQIISVDKNIAKAKCSQYGNMTFIIKMRGLSSSAKKSVVKGAALSAAYKGTEASPQGTPQHICTIQA